MHFAVPTGDSYGFSASARVYPKGTACSWESLKR